MSTLDDDDDDDDIPQLSTHALAALQQFMSEQQEQEERFERLKQKAEDRFEEGEKAEVEEEIVSMDLFKEDWQLSQFWYDDNTSLKLAQEVMNNTRGRVACISAPTAFVKLKSLKPPNARELFLFEYDARFDVYGDRFVRYDFNHPLDFARASELAASMDFVVVDPPFLSEECATKTLNTVRFLAKEGCKVLMCTGAVMRPLVEREIGARMTTFHPRHKGGLANEFRCYTNYPSEAMPWAREDEV